MYQLPCTDRERTKFQGGDEDVAVKSMDSLWTVWSPQVSARFVYIFGVTRITCAYYIVLYTLNDTGYNKCHSKQVLFEDIHPFTV